MTETTEKNLKLEIQQMMGQVLEFAEQELAIEPIPYRRFRQRILRLGNDLIRDFHAESINITKEITSYQITQEKNQ